MTRLTSHRRTRLALPPRVRVWLGVFLALGDLISLAQGLIVRPPLVIGQDAVPPS